MTAAVSGVGLASDRCRPVLPAATAGGRAGPVSEPACSAKPFDFVADLPSLDRLAARHVLLTGITLGLYTPWAKVAWRQRIWQSVRIEGVPLRYTGTVWEIAKPILFAVLGLAGLAILLLLAKWLAVPRPKVTPSPWRLVVTIPMIYVIGLSVWGARGYLLSRTALGGLAGILTGNRHQYAALHFATALMVAPTMGFALPWRQAWLQRRLIEGMHLGHHRFAFEIEPKRLLKRYAVVWATGIATYLSVVLTIAFSSIGPKVVVAKQSGGLPSLDGRESWLCIVLALAAVIVFAAIAAWYRAGVLRHFAAATRMNGRRLHLDLPTGRFVRQALAHAAVKLLSLGLLAPFCEVRRLQLLLGSLRFA